MLELKAVNSSFTQSVSIQAQVIKYLSQHRQLHARSLEAGGQLFGVVDPDSIIITCATGPYSKDDRGPRHYRSDAMSAQSEIKQQAKFGNVYLGEWHTHAEKVPRASGHDIDAMRRLMKSSNLATNGLLMVILGQGLDKGGISVYSYMDGKLLHWDIE
ncbi:Mov34/MPN/PAD-1 family protein [Cellvibrio sp.]|uniref:Mov34/MPN/PAD-1 family protein n=1 Tax=Cellvibrio sp. TaxID=1965322 RepID=UPI0039647424